MHQPETRFGRRTLTSAPRCAQLPVLGSPVPGQLLGRHGGRPGHHRRPLQVSATPDPQPAASPRHPQLVFNLRVAPFMNLLSVERCGRTSAARGIKKYRAAISLQPTVAAPNTRERRAILTEI